MTATGTRNVNTAIASVCRDPVLYPLVWELAVVVYCGDVGAVGVVCERGDR